MSTIEDPIASSSPAGEADVVVSSESSTLGGVDQGPPPPNAQDDPFHDDRTEAQPPATERLWPEKLELLGVGFDPITPEALIRELIAESRRGRGGSLLTPNLDALRLIAGSAPLASAVKRARVVVADGVPLVWASRIQNTPLPARVAGSDLIFTLSGALADAGRTVFLVGGNPGTADKAARRLTDLSPHLKVAGTYFPPRGFDRVEGQVTDIVRAIRDASPDFVYIGLPFDKAALLADRICRELPATWCLGVGVSFSFVAGEIRRAPGWMQRRGLEWFHRMAQEPRRLALRYLFYDPPVAVRLFARAIRARSRGARS